MCVPWHSFQLNLLSNRSDARYRWHQSVVSLNHQYVSPLAGTILSGLPPRPPLGEYALLAPAAGSSPALCTAAICCRALARVFVLWYEVWSLFCWANLELKA